MREKNVPQCGSKATPCAGVFSSASLCCESTAVELQIFHCESTAEQCPVLSRRDFISGCPISFSTLTGTRKWSRETALLGGIANCFAAGSVLPIPVTLLPSQNGML